ncbi:hypothetical protein BT96DRAFT_1091323 [Gymnopus androsaceus JB14]|uniref:DUF6534 domain-containing protein n=1 Tax=Gymnopus androsaceus JB14 TaxID=1447944 RepID=A0A6A4GIT0_9AGAR|nr:hypothetical protein BT96DRAFT_1091323 [Gymnopus androsaceus JB14]
MSGLSAAEQIEINASVGAVVVSNYLSYLTMGIVLSATWTYFSKFPDDKWWFKVLVILCVSMCIGDTIGTGVWSYDWAVANYGNPAVLVFTPWAIPAGSFFLYHLLGSTHYGKTQTDLRSQTPATSGLDMVGGFRLLPVLDQTFNRGADVLITSSMIYYLDPGLRFRIEMHKAQASYHAPRLFRRLILRTVECNLLSLFAQAISLGLFNHNSIGSYYLITTLTLSKVYTFSLLVSLNCRHSGNDSGTSNGGFCLSKRERGIVELTVLHTSSFPSTPVSHIHYISVLIIMPVSEAKPTLDVIWTLANYLLKESTSDRDEVHENMLFRQQIFLLYEETLQPGHKISREIL